MSVMNNAWIYILQTMVLLLVFMIGFLLLLKVLNDMFMKDLSLRPKKEDIEVPDKAEEVEEEEKANETSPLNGGPKDE